jgi:hypothetical protein
MVVQALQTLRTGVLTASFVNGTAIDITETESLMLYFFYTRGAVTGKFQFQIQTSPWSSDQDSGESWAAGSVEQIGIVTPGADSSCVLQRDGYDEYQSIGATEEGFAVDYRICGGARRLRVRARESSGLAFGTLRIYAAMKVN